MVETIERAGVQDRESIAFLFRYAAAGKDDAVIWIAAGNETARAINDRRCRGVVEGGEKFCQASPAALPRRIDGVAHAVLEGQLFRHLPTVLHKPLERSADPGRDRFPAELGIVAELSQQSIADARTRGAAIQEAERTVLTDGRPRGGGSE